PTVQPTTNPTGTGRRSSTTSRPITGRCENSASTSVSSPFSPEPHLPPAPTPAPRSTGAARDVSPGRQRLKAGGVGANNRAGRGAGDGPGTNPRIRLFVNVYGRICRRSAASPRLLSHLLLRPSCASRLAGFSP